MEWEIAAWVDKCVPLLLEGSVTSLEATVQEGKIKVFWAGRKLVIELQPTSETISFMAKTKYKKYGGEEK